DVLAVRELVLLLDAAGDVQVTVVVEVTDVAGPQAAVLREGGAGLLGPAVIAAQHVRAVDDDLPLPAVAGRARVEHHAHAGQRAPHAAEPALPGNIRRYDGARLREPVTLVDRDAEAVHQLGDLGRQ